MFLLFNTSSMFSPLFAAAKAGGAGAEETTSPPGKQQPGGSEKGADSSSPSSSHNDNNDDGLSGTVMDEFTGYSGADILKNAPLIDPNTGKPIDQSVGKSEVAKDAAQEKVEQPKDQQPQQAASEKFKLDEQEYEIEQIRQWKKDSEDKANWQKKLTQESQLDNFMRSLQPDVKDAFIARAIADVYAKKDPNEYLNEGDESDISLILEDEYGDEVEQTIPRESEQYKTLAEHFEKIFLKKYQPAFIELKQHKEQLKQFDDEQKRFYKEASQRQAIEFLKEHPEIGIPVSDGMDLEKTLVEALSGGPTHPHYRPALRFYSLGKQAAEMGMPLKEYYNLLYDNYRGNHEIASKITAQDKTNQQDDGGERPSKGTQGGDFIDQLLGSHGTTHESLVAEFDKGKIINR